MSNYDILLAEAKSTITGTAKHYIPKLYDILTKEENKPPEEARNIIEHDLALYWTKAIIARHLPQEAKDKNKVKAGKAAAEVTNLILAEGQSVTTESDDLENVRPDSNDWEEPSKDVPVKDSTEFYKEQKEDNPLEVENQFLKEENEQLKDALHKTEQFKPATDLQGKVETFPPLHDDEVFEYLSKRHDGTHKFWFPNYGRELFKNRIISQLENSGVKTFKRLYFEV